MNSPRTMVLAMHGPNSSGPHAHAVGTRRGLSPLRQRGFTMVEMLATVSVLLILMSVAAGTFNATMSNNRAYGVQSEILASLSLAKTEALRRGSPVVVTATAPVTGNEFGAGWTVWVDSNNNGSFENGEVVVRTHEALPQNIRVSSGGANAIRYGVLGFLVPAGSIALSVCPVNAAQTGGGYLVALTPNGMADATPSQSC